MNKMYVLTILREGEAHPRPYGVGDFRYMQELIEDYVVVNHIYGKGVIDFRIEDFERYFSRTGEGKVINNKCILCKNRHAFYKTEACMECKKEHKPVNYCGAFEPRKEVVENGK